MRAPVQLIAVLTILAAGLPCYGQTGFRDEPVDLGTVTFVMPNIDRQTFEVTDLEEIVQEMADSIARGIVEGFGDALSRTLGASPPAPADSRPDRPAKPANEAANSAMPAASANRGDSPGSAKSDGVRIASGISASGIEYSIALVEDGHRALAEITGAPATHDAQSTRVRHRITREGIESAMGARIDHLKAQRLFGFNGASFSVQAEGRTAWMDFFLIDGKLLTREAVLPANRSTSAQRAEYARFLSSFRKGSQP